MASSSSFQYDQVPGAFPSDEDESMHSSSDSSSNSQVEPPYTEEDFVEMMNDVTREIVDENDGNFLSPSSVPQQTQKPTYLAKERPGEAHAAFEQFQQREQTQFGRLRHQNSGSNVAASAPSHDQPTYPRQPSYTAYERYDTSQYGQSGRNDRTTKSREEMLRYGKATALDPASKNQGSSTSRTPGRTGGHPATYIPQPTRQQSTWSQNSAYRGAYGDLSNDQGYPHTGYQQSPSLLPGQEPHDLRHPPSAFQTRTPALQGAHALPSGRQGFYTSENAVDARPQSTGARTSSVNAARPSEPSFTDPESLSQSVIDGNINAKRHPADTHNTKAGQSEAYLESSDESEGPQEEPKKQTIKKKRGPPKPKCATLRKTIHNQGETKVVNGQLMWSDPNEPEDKQWKPAVVMDDIRKYILRQQDREARALGCSYLYPDVPGGEPYGDTAFFFQHRHLGEARHTRPDILFAIDETDTNNPQPSYDPGWMMYDPVKKEISDSGTVMVLNPADNPIVNWKEIPLCISPHMDGFKMEYMRRVNKAIRQQDVWARMPRRYWQKPGDPQTLRQISIENTMVNMPSKRFRQKAGCLVWTDRGGSAEIELGLKELLNKTAVGHQCIAANSMRGFGRDLNAVEQLQVKRGNANGRYLKNAGNRAVDEATRNERRAKEDKRIAKAQRAEDSSMPATSAPSVSAAPATRGAASQPVESRKRNRSVDDEDSELSENNISIQQRPNKRNRTAKKEHGGPSEDDDLAMFDQPQLVVEDFGLAERYQLWKSARKEVIHRENSRVEESSEESSSGEGEEYVDEEVSGAEAESEDDDDAYIPDIIPEPVTEKAYIHIEDEEEEDGDDGGEGDLDDEGGEGGEPETATPQQVSKDPYHQLFGASNAEAKESDLEAHRKWVRELLYEDQEDYASSLERRRTAQPPTRYPNAINPTSPSGATASPIDYSEVDPSNDREVGSLATALLPTKKMFWEWTGQTVPQPNREKSYGYQFRKLHKAFDDWWSKNREDPPPILVGVTHWGSSVDNWEPVKKDAVYYEAYKKGHRAPRDDYGRIINVPGPLLEKFSDIL